MANKRVVFHPIISPIQKIALYETKSRFYLMGTNNTQTRFRVLKIDRMEPRELVVVDDKVEYSQEEIRELVTRIDVGNRTRIGQRLSSNGVARIVSAFGIVGFIRFLEGYYIILITKRRLVAVIGHHTIYKIEDTSMIYIPNDGVRISHPDEPRYVKMFQNIDLSSNFYFSYSYDITHTLQSNMTPPRTVIPEHEKSENGEDLFDNEDNSHHCSESSFAVNNDVQSAADYFSVWSFGEQNSSEVLKDDKNKPNDEHPEVLNYGVRNSPNYRFVWNNYLLSKVEESLHPDWILYVTHGFVGQSNISIFGRPVYITLIARRSNKYAGTRFLKRGANFQGDVANEVETEQIVHDSGLSSLSLGHFSAFVQLRGSIPAQWSQDISKIVPKPAISFDLSDPFAETAGEHFNQLFQRYGSPIIILNLVKKREKKKHESMLSEEFSTAIAYLNQFLPPDHQIQYISFDMARIFKGKEANVMGRLGDIAHTTVCKTGIFHNQPPYYTQNSHAVLGFVDKNENSFGRRLQTGIIRVNCVDCLDRTNTAQFAIGKCALGFQLCALGVLDEPRIDFDSDCVRMLEELYEDHGDTLALQYGGSQLVHRIKTYRKTAPWTSQGNDIMQTLSRYYSNTFSDAEKQHTINLFLGLFVPDESRPPIWEMATDYYLHHKLDIPNKRARSQWWDTNAVKFLPRAYEEVNKQYCQLVPISSTHDEAVDSYADYYRPYELTVLCNTFAFKISHSVRDFMPNFTTNFSPFAVRVRPGRRREEMGAKGSSMKNPSLSGQSSSSSTTSSASSTSDTEESEEEEHRSDSQPTPSKDSSSDYITFETLFPPMRQVYGMEIENPKKADIAMYKRFALLGSHANSIESPQPSKSVRLIQQSAFSLDSSVNVTPPRVSRQSIEIYKQYVNRGKFGATDPSPTDLMKYQNFVNNTVLNSSSWDESVY